MATFITTQLFNAANKAVPAPSAPNIAPLEIWQTEQFWLYCLAVLVGLSGLAVAICVKVRDTKKKSAIEGIVGDQKSLLARNERQLENATSEQKRAVGKAEIAQLVAIHDDLIPVAASLADMARWPRDVRTLYVKTVAGTAAAALQSIALRDKVERPRAVVYLIDAEAEPPEMQAVGFKGRGKTPRPFKRGTPRGDAAMGFVFEGSPGAIWPDLNHHKPEGYDGTASDYRTFVSMPITTEGGAYGMVTLDAPQPDSLTEGHRAITALIAELMAIALEVSQDEDPAAGDGRDDDSDPGRVDFGIYR